MLFRSGMAALVLVSATVAMAQGTSSLTFVRFAGQGPSGALVADPVVRPPLPAHVALAASIDTQGSGRPDLFLCHAAFAPSPPADHPCRFLRPHADGTLSDVSRALLGAGALPTVMHPRDIVMGDFNGDGRPDIFIADTGHDAPPFPGKTNLLLVSNGDGTYADRSLTLPQTPDFSHSACSGDVNRDGKLDIYVGNVGAGEPYFLIGKGDGTFAMTRRGLPDQLNRMHSLACLIVDVDGDGNTDLVLGAWSNPDPRAANLKESTILLGDGTGDFTRRSQALPTGPLGAANTQVMDIVATDVNGDGRADLILLSTQLDPAYVGMALQVVVNRGNGTFTDETPGRLGPAAVRRSGEWCIFLQLVDIDGDGLKDIYCNAAGLDDGLPRFWLNNGDGSWSVVEHDPLPAGLRGWHIQFVDNDGDGRLDLLRVNATPAGDVQYHSFQNRTPRKAPAPRTVVEFYHAGLDHYFITWLPGEIALLDAGTILGGWSRTGRVFSTFAGPPGEVTHMCRIYIPPARGNSHFYGRGSEECAAAMSTYPDFVMEDGAFMAMRLPDAGVCPFGSTPVYRVFSNRADANHRYMTDKATRTAMLAKGWLAEGEGPDLTVMCAGDP